MLEQELNVEGVFASEKTMKDEWGWSENLAYVRLLDLTPPAPMILYHSRNFKFKFFLKTALPQQPPKHI